MKDPVIRIKDLLALFLKKVKLLFLLTIIFAVVLCGYKYVSDSSTQQKILSAQSENENLSTELTDEDMEEVQTYIETITMRDAIVDYHENSIYMNGNPYNLYYAQVEYNVTGSSAEGQRNAVIALRNYISEGLPEDMSELDENKLAARYFREALTVESTGYYSYLDNSIVQIKVYAATEKDAEAYAVLLDNAITGHALALNESGMEYFRINKIYEVVSSEYFGRIISEINAQKSLLEEYENRVSTLKESLSKQQLAEAFKIMKVEENVDAETEEVVPEEVVPEVSLNMAYLILGAVLGLALGVVGIAAKYIFTNTIKTNTDINELFGLLNFGHITTTTLNNWDKNINKIFYPNQSFEIEEEKKSITSKLKIYCKKNQIDTFAIVGSPEETEILSEIAKDLQKSQISCDVMERSNVEGLEKVQNIIMTGKIGKTNYGMFESELLFYRGQEIQVLGYITIM